MDVQQPLEKELAARRRLLTKGRAARVSHDSLYLPGLPVRVLGPVSSEETGAQMMIRVRSADGRTVALPACFLSPVDNG